MERVTGIEPALAAWEAAVMPFHYTRVAGWPGAQSLINDYSRYMSTEDYGSSRSLFAAALMLIGGIAITLGTWMGYQEGVRHPATLMLGVVGGGYFLIAGAVRVAVGLLTRRSQR